MDQILQMYRVMFEEMVQGAFFQLADGTLSDVNQSALDLFGLTRDQFMDRTSYHPDWRIVNENGSILPPDQHPSMIALKTGVPVKGVVLGVYSPVRKEMVWMNVNAIPMFKGEDEPPYQVFVSIHDVTEQKMTEVNLRKSEERFRSIVENTPNIVMIHVDGKFVYLNPAAVETFAISGQEEYIGKPVIEVVHPDYRDLVHKRVSRISESGQINLKTEELLLRKDGSAFWVEITGIPLTYGGEKAVLAIAVDISERIKGEKALQESKNLLGNIIELSPISMAIVSLDGTIEQVNRRAIKTFGYLPEDIPNMERWWVQAYPDEFYRCDVITQWMGLVEKAIANKSEIERREYRVTCKDGTIKTILIFGIPVSDKLFVMFDDITERKNTEEQIINLNIELENRVNKRTAELESINKELEEFCYSLSHEFRAPIARLEGFGDMLLENLEDGNKELMIHCARRIITASSRLRTVIDSLLTINRLSRVDITLSPVNLSKMSSQIFSELMEQVKNRVVNIRIEPDIIVQGDRYMLDICIRNLLGNAIKYTSGSVVASVEIGQKIIDGEKVCFVRDNGIGFNMEHAKNLFVPFCRLHAESEFEGTGIGLATVRRIIEKHNGRIWAEAKQGKGATFYFTLGVPEVLNYESLSAAD